MITGRICIGQSRIKQLRPREYRAVINEFSVGNGAGQTKSVSVEFGNDGTLTLYQGMGETPDTAFEYGCMQMSLNKDEASFLISAIKKFDLESYFSVVEDYLKSQEENDVL